MEYTSRGMCLCCLSNPLWFLFLSPSPSKTLVIDWQCPTDLLSLLSHCVSVWIYVNHTQMTYFFCKLCYLLTVLKEFFISDIVPFISSISIWLLLPLSAKNFPLLCTCCAPFPTGFFNMLTRATVKHLSDSSNSWVIFKSCSIDYFTSWQWFFFFFLFFLMFMSHNFDWTQNVICRRVENEVNSI